MLCNKTWRKIVQAVALMVLVTAFAWPLQAAAQTGNAVKEESTAAKVKAANTDEQIEALIAALGGPEYAEKGGSSQVWLKKSATVSSGRLTVPESIELYVSGLDGLGNTLTVEAPVNFEIKSGGSICVFDGSFLKMDCAITGDPESICVDGSSSVSGLSSLASGLFTPGIPDGKVMGCTDLSGKRTVYAATENGVDPEAFIIKNDGRGALYAKLGKGTASAFYLSEAGDTVYLMKDELISKGFQSVLNPLKKGVTLIIKNGQKLEIDFLSLAGMAMNGEGTVVVYAGGSFCFPWNNYDKPDIETVVGAGTDAIMKIETGSFKLRFPQKATTPDTRKAANKAAAAGDPAQAILTKDSIGFVQKPLYLKLKNDAIHCTMEEGSQMTVTGALVLPGNADRGGRPSNLIMERDSGIRTKGRGFLFLDAETETWVKSGGSLAAETVDGREEVTDTPPGFKSYLKGSMIFEANSNLDLQGDKLIGGSDARLSITQGNAKVNLDPNKQLQITGGSKAVLNKDWRYELKSNNSPHDNYLDNLAIDPNAKLTLNAALTIPAGATFNLNGDLVLGSKGKLILEEGSTFNNDGHIYMEPGAEISGGSSFKMLPFEKKVFRSEKEGYKNPETLKVTVKSSGTKNTGNLSVALSGSSAKSFSVTPSGDIGSLSPGSAGKEFTVVPKTGLKKGTYTAAVTVSSSNISATFPISFTVKAVSAENGNTPGAGDSSNTPGAGGSSNSHGDRKTPGTGDDGFAMEWAVLLIALSLIAGCTAAFGYRRKTGK